MTKTTENSRGVEGWQGMPLTEGSTPSPALKTPGVSPTTKENTVTEPTASVFDSLWETTMSDRGFVSFDARTNTVDLQGLHTGKVTALSARLNEVLDGYVTVLHEEGGSYFVGRGMQSYAGATTRTILVEQEPRSIGSGQATYRYVTLSSPVETKTNTALRSASTQLVIERLGKALAA